MSVGNETNPDIFGVFVEGKSEFATIQINRLPTINNRLTTIERVSFTRIESGIESNTIIRTANQYRRTVHLIPIAIPCKASRGVFRVDNRVLDVENSSFIDDNMRIIRDEQIEAINRQFTTSNYTHISFQSAILYPFNLRINHNIFTIRSNAHRRYRNQGGNHQNAEQS